MSRRMYYQIDDSQEAFAQVMLIKQDGPEEVAVYCPPGVANGPWIEGFDTLASAMDLAALLAKQNSQPAVVITYDTGEWWLDGLTLISDSDRRQLDDDV